MGLWRKIVDTLVKREEEPTPAEDEDEVFISTSPYPTADVLGEQAASREDADAQREGEGFR
jgi:hypothetical protein